MRKIISLLLSVCMLLCLTACQGDSEHPLESESTLSTDSQDTTENTVKEPEQPVAEHLTLGKYFSRKDEWDGDILLAVSEYNAVTLLDDSTKKNPTLAETLDQTYRMTARSMEDEFDNLLATAKDELALLGADSFVTKASTLDVQIRRADSVAISLLSDSYLIYGNINDRSLHGTTYDTASGEPLMLTDVIKDMSKIPAIVKKELTSHTWTGDFTDETAVEDYFRDTPYDDLSWTLDYNGVTFYFGNGDIAQIGRHEYLSATVSFAEYPDLFEEKYIAVPDSYIVELSLNQPFCTDLDGDGTLEELDVTPVLNESGLFYESFDIYTDTDAQHYHAELSANITHRTGGYHPYYIKNANGRHYLYVFAEGSELASTDMKLHMIDITEGKCKEIGEMCVGLGYLQADCLWALTDPNNMMLENFELMEEPAAYHVGNDGIPVRK